MTEPTTRRVFLGRFAAVGAALTAPALLAACGGGGAPTAAAECDGYDALTPQDLQMRQGLQYVDATPDPAKMCSNCIQYTAPTGGPCGGCKLFAGPVVPGGYCSVWAATA
jgi:hypothetical protein